MVAPLFKTRTSCLKPCTKKTPKTKSPGEYVCQDHLIWTHQCRVFCQNMNKIDDNATFFSFLPWVLKWRFSQLAWSCMGNRIHHSFKCIFTKCHVSPQPCGHHCWDLSVISGCDKKVTLKLSWELEKTFMFCSSQVLTGLLVGRWLWLPSPSPLFCPSASFYPATASGSMFWKVLIPLRNRLDICHSDNVLWKLLPNLNLV